MNKFSLKLIRNFTVGTRITFYFPRNFKLFETPPFNNEGANYMRTLFRKLFFWTEMFVSESECCVSELSERVSE